MKLFEITCAKGERQEIRYVAANTIDDAIDGTIAVLNRVGGIGWSRLNLVHAKTLLEGSSVIVAGNLSSSSPIPVSESRGAGHPLPFPARTS